MPSGDIGVVQDIKYLDTFKLINNTNELTQRRKIALKILVASLLLITGPIYLSILKHPPSPAFTMLTVSTQSCES